MEDLMMPAEACAYLRISESTLKRWRYKGEGPRFINLGDENGKPIIRYQKSLIDKWLESHYG